MIVVNPFDGRLLSVPTSGGGSAPSFKGALIRPSDTLDVSNAYNDTTINFTSATVIYDTDGFYSSGNPSRLTIPSGISKVRIQVNAAITNLYGGSFGNTATIKLFKNGSQLFVGAYPEQKAGPIFPQLNIHTPAIEVASGDYFQIVINAEHNYQLQINNTFFAIEVIA